MAPERFKRVDTQEEHSQTASSHWCPERTEEETSSGPLRCPVPCQALKKSQHYCIFAAPVCDVALIRLDLICQSFISRLSARTPTYMQSKANCARNYRTYLRVYSLYSGVYIHESSGHFRKLFRASSRQIAEKKHTSISCS